MALHSLTLQILQAHTVCPFGGDKTLKKRREEESGRVGSLGVQNYLWDTPDNVLRVDE